MTWWQVFENLFIPVQSRSSLQHTWSGVCNSLLVQNGDEGSMDFICGAETVPEERQLGKAWQSVWRINGFPQTHRPAAGCGALAFLKSGRDPGDGAIALVLWSFDLAKVMCLQGLFKRVTLGCRKCRFHPLPSCSWLCFPCW